MPGGYSIDTERRLVFTRGWGKLTDADFIGHVSALRTDPAFDPTMSQIVDLRDSDPAGVTADGVRSIAMLNPFTAPSRRAAVVATDAMYGMLRMYSMMRPQDGDDVLFVFRSLEEAITWLGLPDEPATIDAILRSVPPMFAEG